MYAFFCTVLERSLSKQVPATGIGLFRCFYGVIVLQEVIFLLYFNALIFDQAPYLKTSFPLIPLFICLWVIVALCLIAGLYCHISTIANYFFWVIFVSLTPMRHDFGGGFDQFMVGVGLLLILLPVDRCFSLDRLRIKLRIAKLDSRSVLSQKVSILAYYLPVTICLSFLYFDSAIHKMFAEHWRNGLGVWLPAISPYYISALDLSWLLNSKPLQMTLGYAILIFQFTFAFLVFVRRCRVALLCFGVALHIGITLVLNIYPFGLGMLICYVLLVPFKWWRKLATILVCKSPSLMVFYDVQSVTANRSAIIIKHFDVCNAINFQTQQNQIIIDSQQHKHQDMVVVDGNRQIYSGLKAWIKVFIGLRYCAFLGWILLIPSVFKVVNKKYRSSAVTDEQRQSKILPTPSYYDRIFEHYGQQQPQKLTHYLRKILIVVFLLQLNSTLHYGIVYRIEHKLNLDSLLKPLDIVSNSILVLSHTFMGITPHALYLHDHFEGYKQILAITYNDAEGQMLWLPFVNQQGRLLAPNWGRVQSMWANVAVTPNIDASRLAKFIMKITAFWGGKMNLDLEQTTFTLKRKNISTPFTWEHDLRNKNLQGSWQNVGTASWKNLQFSVQFSDKWLKI